MSEKDPSGKNPHSPGAKLDAGKLRVNLVLGDFAHALEAVVEVGTFGANKYSPSGWLSVEDAEERYADAAGRHWLKMAQGEEIDPDSGLPHLAHYAWNILAGLELTMRGTHTEKRSLKALDAWISKDQEQALQEYQPPFNRNGLHEQEKTAEDPFALTKEELDMWKNNQEK